MFGIFKLKEKKSTHERFKEAPAVTKDKQHKNVLLEMNRCYYEKEKRRLP